MRFFPPLLEQIAWRREKKKKIFGVWGKFFWRRRSTHKSTAQITLFCHFHWAPPWVFYLFYFFAFLSVPFRPFGLLQCPVLSWCPARQAHKTQSKINFQENIPHAPSTTQKKNAKALGQKFSRQIKKKQKQEYSREYIICKRKKENRRVGVGVLGASEGVGRLLGFSTLPGVAAESESKCSRSRSRCRCRSRRLSRSRSRS